jgi:hypothetical protein
MGSSLCSRWWNLFLFAPQIDRKKIILFPKDVTLKSNMAMENLPFSSMMFHKNLHLVWGFPSQPPLITGFP